ncbi:PEGA domain-containing protein [Alcaligenes faecalis]|uniref:PEGA domain-containing protein n=1 Tax=Alcaligenes faecalis TaxID=511 RepID=UPI001EF140F2|nr:PEGA domain-containing protein [Alcaligenes faecalis]ULH06553.1 PEGA domain-containing protein [Alcaligenes faecalis]
MKRTHSAKDVQGRPLGQILDSLSLDQRLVILDQLALQLAELHEHQEWYGALGLGTVVLSDEGLVQLLPLEQNMHKRSLAQARAQGMAFDEPCAAPEQYVDDPVRPAGPWTDVYAYAALRWQLTTGFPLMAAPWRQLKDPVVMDEDADGPTRAMLQGLALDWVQRPQSMASYRRLERLGQVPEPVPAHAPAAQTVLPITPERRSSLPLWLAGLAVVVLAGLGAAYWSGDGDTSGPAVAASDSNRPAVVGATPEEPTTRPGQGSITSELQGGLVAAGESKPNDVAVLGAGGASAPQSGQPLEAGSDQLGSQSTGAQNDSVAGQQLAQASGSQAATTPELKLLAESGALQPALPVQTQNTSDDTARLALADHAAGTADTTGASGATGGEVAATGSPGVRETIGAAGSAGATGATGINTSAASGVATSTQAESSAPSAQVDHVEQLEPVAAKPAPPAKGTIALDIRPWGEVYVNGRKQGVSPPLKSLSLAPGSHRIVVKNAGLPEFSTTIRVRSGKTASVSHEFK